MMEWKEPGPRSTDSWVQVAALSVLKWMNLGSSPNCLRLKLPRRWGVGMEGAQTGVKFMERTTLKSISSFCPLLWNPVIAQVLF